MIQDMLMTEKGINWNDLPTHQKRGSCCIKEVYFTEHEDGKELYWSDGKMLIGTYRTRWIIDNEIPIFKDEGRDYIEKLIRFCNICPCSS
jgi:tRNA(His) 5'-end guanylyltransferase